MTHSLVNVFFYGSYMNFQVLQEVDIDERTFEICSISGYELTISPLANLSKKEHGTAYGILTRLTHAELDRLYRDHAEKLSAGSIYPKRSLSTGQTGRFRLHCATYHTTWKREEQMQRMWIES